MCICNHGDNLTMVISVVWGGPVTMRFYIHLKLDEPPWALTPAAFQCAQEPAVPEAGSGHSFCPPTTIPTPVAAFFWASEFDSPLWLQQVSQLLSFFLFFLPFNKQEQGHAMPCKVWSGSFPKRADLFRSQRLRPAQPRAPLVALPLTLLMRPRLCWSITGRGTPIFELVDNTIQMLIYSSYEPSDKPTWPPRGILDLGVDFEVRYFEDSCLGCLSQLVTARIRGLCLVRSTTVGWFQPSMIPSRKVDGHQIPSENPRNPLVSLG